MKTQVICFANNKGGSGKSTTINCILSLLNFEKGSIQMMTLKDIKIEKSPDWIAK